MGVPEEDVEFDRAMADWVRGDLEGARERLVKLSNRQPGETRAWMALASGASVRAAMAVRGVVTEWSVCDQDTRSARGRILRPSWP